ncbi:MAG: hypothetical protein IPG03_03270 [Candidatus Microthrix sp.]|nr:hypothetical protein [Candidatus Microthrix sp.]MBK6501414.1 hypothetical protein [Candidatus Microthrix sp.]
MRATLRIGRLFGVPLYIQWSVLIVGGLIAWLTSNSLVSRAGVDTSTGISLGLSFVAAIWCRCLCTRWGTRWRPVTSALV